MVQEHNYTLGCANTDCVSGIGLYHCGLDRTLQLGQCFAAVLQGRAVPLFGML
jgi:hypothetical protein